MLERLPELNEKFVAWYRALFADGALDRKTKELIGIAASLTAGCQP
jgi:alkylhydroperoxidase/carboxymuconolactone decarboxylase family protein YurZ